MNLAKAEFARLFARRFTWIMLAVVTAISAIIVVAFGIDSTQRTPEVIAAAEREADEQREVYDRERERCEEDVASGENGYPPDFDCAQAFDPSQISAEWFLPSIFSFSQDTGEIIGVVGFLLALLGFAVAASFIGAEWSSGGVANLLLWRPRRLPVLFTKLVVALLAVAGIGVLLLGLLTAALYVVASLRGTVDGTTADTWRILALTAARAIGLAAATTAIGFSLASIGRGTAMALGFAIGYVVVIEIGLQIVLTLANARFPQAFLGSTYVFAWLGGGSTLEDYSVCNSPEAMSSMEPCMPAEMTISLTDSVLVGGVVITVFVLLASALFARRDVT